MNLKIDNNLKDINLDKNMNIRRAVGEKVG